jgi:uncharacterized membrane protein
MGFVIGLVTCVLAAFLSFSWFSLVLVVLGLIVGFLNVTPKEAQGFLIPAIALTISAGAVQSLPQVRELVTNIMAGVVALVSPAILVVGSRLCRRPRRIALPRRAMRGSSSHKAGRLSGFVASMQRPCGQLKSGSSPALLLSGV